MIAAILMIATSGVLSAQNTKPGNGNPGTNKNMPGFVDANNNGVCDTYESGNRQAVKGAVQGQRLNKGQGSGYGKGNGRCGSPATQGRGAWNRGCRRAV